MSKPPNKSDAADIIIHLEIFWGIKKESKILGNGLSLLELF